MKTPVLYLLPLLLLAIGCKPLRKIGTPAAEPITESNYEKLTGQYEFHSKDVWPHLWVMIAPYKRLRRVGESRITVDWDTLYVALRPISPRKLAFDLYDERGMVVSKTVKGKIHDGYFYGRQHIIVAPLPILFGYDFFKYRIGIDGTDLVIDERRHNFVDFFLIHVSSEGYRGTQKFARR